MSAGYCSECGESQQVAASVTCDRPGGHATVLSGSACHFCGPTGRELRPYGPGGSLVCFPCATATPERDATSQSAFGALLDATEAISPSGAVAFGGAEGPQPFDPNEIGGTR
jgi:hypothetical protein